MHIFFSRAFIENNRNTSHMKYKFNNNKLLMELLFIYQRNFKTFYNELTVLLFVDRSEW